MEREVNLKDIQKLYGLNDMVKADSNGCQGCSDCCRGMGSSIILDPLDIQRLETGLNVSFQGLLAGKIELNVVDGLILPNLKMAGEQESCAFLNPDGRCSIHGYRPGLCRLFPLGRYYEEGSFKYYLQTQECTKPNKSKVKVKKWIDTHDLKEYEGFVAAWHYFLKNLQGLIKSTKDEDLKKDINMYILNAFYIKPYQEEESFYIQFQERLAEAEKVVAAVSW